MESIRLGVRRLMRTVAKALDKVSGGHISPDFITFVGLLAHVGIAYLIAVQENYWAAGLLVVFALFDALDGELARMQGKASSAGMVLDATTDRIKEVLLYMGTAYAIAAMGRPNLAFWSVAACGASLCVSYVKAKGETAMRGSKLTPNEINRVFADGLMRYEVRMAVLVVGLLVDRVILAVAIIAIASTLTAFGRLYRITKALR